MERKSFGVTRDIANLRIGSLRYIWVMTGIPAVMQYVVLMYELIICSDIVKWVVRVIEWSEFACMT